MTLLYLFLLVIPAVLEHTPTTPSSELETTVGPTTTTVLTTVGPTTTTVLTTEPVRNPQTISSDYQTLGDLKQDLAKYTLKWLGDHTFNNGRLFSFFDALGTEEEAKSNCINIGGKLWTIKEEDHLNWIFLQLEDQGLDGTLIWLDFVLKSPLDEILVTNIDGPIPEITAHNEIITWKEPKPTTYSHCLALNNKGGGKYELVKKDCGTKYPVVCVRETSKAATYKKDVQQVISQAQLQVQEILEIYEESIQSPEYSNESVYSDKSFGISSTVTALQTQLEDNIDETQFLVNINNLKYQVLYIFGKAQPYQQVKKGISDLETRVREISSLFDSCSCSYLSADRLITYICSFLSLLSIGVNIYLLCRKSTTDHPNPIETHIPLPHNPNYPPTAPLPLEEVPMITRKTKRYPTNLKRTPLDENWQH